MDQTAAVNANRVLGNNDDSLVLEMMYSGPQLLVLEACDVAFRGANFQFLVNGVEKDVSKPISLHGGDRVQFKPGPKGVFGYLAIRGGFKSNLLLGSGAYLSGSKENSTLRKGDVLQAVVEPKSNTGLNEQEVVLDYDSDSLQVYPGPEYGAFADQLSTLETRLWTLASSSNRMSYQLEEVMEEQATGIITAPVQAGTVQLTPSGRLMVLMRDCQTTGGYARILQLTDLAVDQLAQKRPGSSFSFSLIH